MVSMSQFIEMFGGGANRIKLSSLCSTFVDGDWIESKDQSELGIRLIQTGNVGNGFFKDKKDKSRYISEETFDNLHCTEIYPGDILVSRLPDPIGRACIIPQGLGRTITAVDCTIIRLKDIILPDYFIAYTMTPSYAAQINEVTTGTTRRRISRANLGNILIPCSSIAKQQQFVAIAKQADKSKFGGFKSQFIEMFGSKCRTDAIGNLLKITSGGTPSSKKQEYYEGGTIPWLTSGEVSQGIISSTKSFITEAGLNNSSAKWVSKGSVVVAMYGATAGKTGILDIDTTTNQAVCSLLPSDNFTSIYLYYAVKSNEKWMMDQATGGAQPNISQTVIKKMVIPVPSIEQQHQFASIAQQADKSKYVLLKLICTINNPDKFIN